MCLTIPGKIISIKEGMATIKNGRETAQIDLSLVFDVQPGDWILYATNRAVKKISEDDAKEIISLLEDYYHPVDIAKLPLKFKKIIFKVRSGNSNLTKEEIVYLLNLKGRNNLETLYAEANTLRKERIKDFICIHGIVEFSNYCKNNCLYCGIRNDSKVERYRMTPTEIIKTAGSAVNKEGYKLIVLQSGEDDYYSDEDLIKLISDIQSKMRVFIFLSVGERSVEFYTKAYQAGATGALIRFETSNEKLYSSYRPEHKLADRIKLIKFLRKTGYYVATGSLFGLPNQNIEDIADDLITLKKLKIPMVSSGPFLQAKNTPLFCHPRAGEAMTRGSSATSGFPIRSGMTEQELLELTLKYIAVARFLMPEIKIPVTTALETLDRKNGRHKGLLAGANSLMFNLTPEKYCDKYLIYDNKYREREKVWQKYGLFKSEESWEMLEDRMRIK